MASFGFSSLEIALLGVACLGIPGFEIAGVGLAALGISSLGPVGSLLAGVGFVPWEILPDWPVDLPWIVPWGIAPLYPAGLHLAHFGIAALEILLPGPAGLQLVDLVVAVWFA